MTKNLKRKRSVPKYVQEDAMANIRMGNGYVLLPSDRDGYMHLYLYNQNGQLMRRIAPGNYDITAVYGYDEQTGDVYYQAAALNPHDRQVYVMHKNGQAQRLTQQEGWNDAVFSGDYKYFVNTWSNYDTPYVYTTRDNRGKVISTNIDNKELVAKLKEYGWTKRETFSFTTSEGVKLDGWMVKPANFDSSKKYPVIMFQYSGPGSQEVKNSWSSGSMGQGGAFDQYLAQQGFIVACVDGRGTGGRGVDFENPLYFAFKAVEGQVEAPVLVEIPQRQRQVAQNVEPSPFRQPPRLAEVIRHARPGLIVVLGVKIIQIHPVEPLRQHVDGADDKIHFRRVGDQLLRMGKIPGSVPQFHAQPQGDAVADGLPGGTILPLQDSPVVRPPQLCGAPDDGFHMVGEAQLVKSRLDGGLRHIRHGSIRVRRDPGVGVIVRQVHKAPSLLEFLEELFSLLVVVVAHGLGKFLQGFLLTFITE